MKLFFFECFLLQTLEPKVYIRPLFIQNPLPSSNLQSHESLDDKDHIKNTETKEGGSESERPMKKLYYFFLDMEMIKTLKKLFRYSSTILETNEL